MQIWQTIARWNCCQCSEVPKFKSRKPKIFSVRSSANKSLAMNLQEPLANTLVTAGRTKFARYSPLLVYFFVILILLANCRWRQPLKLKKKHSAVGKYRWLTASTPSKDQSIKDRTVTTPCKSYFFMLKYFPVEIFAGATPSCLNARGVTTSALRGPVRRIEMSTSQRRPRRRSAATTTVMAGLIAPAR